MNINTDIPQSLAAPLAQTEALAKSFLFALAFTVQDTARESGYIDNHLLSYTAQDFLQSALALPLLTRDGIHNVCRRELRFILEMSIKLCNVQQQQYTSTIHTKLSTLQTIIDSKNISMQKQITLSMLPESEVKAFNSEVGRLYGEMCRYVHLTQSQIMERIKMVDEGRTSGKESADDIDLLNKLIHRGLSASLVFLLHSVPEYVAGDLLVQADGSSFSWPFAASKYIALMDEHFDYKHERKAGLDKIRSKRWSVVAS